MADKWACQECKATRLTPDAALACAELDRQERALAEKKAAARALARKKS